MISSNFYGPTDGPTYGTYGHTYGNLGLLSLFFKFSYWTFLSLCDYSRVLDNNPHSESPEVNLEFYAFPYTQHIHVKTLVY